MQAMQNIATRMFFDIPCALSKSSTRIASSFTLFTSPSQLSTRIFLTGLVSIELSGYDLGIKSGILGSLFENGYFHL
jgi:hypothetical protein